MQKAVKILALVLILVLSFTVFSGCGKEKLTREMGRYSYWVVRNSDVAKTLSDYSELLMYQELEKRTGIKIDFMHPTSGSTGSEAFSILMASNDMPDMIEYNWRSYPGGPDAAISNKAIISLNKYLEEYAPNYYSYMEGEKSKENPLYRAQTITPNGNYYGFKGLSLGNFRCFGGFIVRKDMLDKWGLDVPVTIDDWTNVFKTAKANGVSKPFTCQANVFSITGNEIFNSAWGVGKVYHVEDGKVVFSLEKSEYKDYIEQMANWYKAGYIDADFLTNDSTVIESNMTNGSSVACFGYVGSTMGKLIPAMESRDPNYNIVACPYPVLKEGDQSIIQPVGSESTEPAIAITTACGIENEERYKEAIKWCDYLYSDEGLILKCFGVKGVTYKEEQQSDGSIKYKYTVGQPDVMKKIGANDMSAALYHFFIPANAPGFNQHEDYLDGYYPYQQQKDAIKLWNENVEIARKRVMPTLTYTDNEAETMNRLNTVCQTELDMNVADMIMGKKPISDFDSVVAKAKKDGYDEITKIRQAAFDKYNATIKQ